MSMCRDFSCVIGKGFLLQSVHSFGKTLLAFSLLHFVIQGQVCLLLWVFLDFHFCIPLPWIIKSTSFFFFFGVNLGLVGLVELFTFSFFSISDWGIDLDYCDTEWLALETKRDHSVIFEIAPKYCISNSFVDYEDTPFFLRDACPQYRHNGHLS